MSLPDSNPRKRLLTVNVCVADMPAFSDFIERVRDFIAEYAWHNRWCAAVDADGEWREGNPECDCGYDESLTQLFDDASVMALSDSNPSYRHTDSGRPVGDRDAEMSRPASPILGRLATVDDLVNPGERDAGRRRDSAERVTFGVCVADSVVTGSGRGSRLSGGSRYGGEARHLAARLFFLDQGLEAAGLGGEPAGLFLRVDAVGGLVEGFELLLGGHCFCLRLCRVLHACSKANYTAGVKGSTQDPPKWGNGVTDEGMLPYPDPDACPRCNGGGIEPGATWRCERCKGSGLVDQNPSSRRNTEMQSDWFIREVKRCSEIGMPLGCCDEWPECSHMLAWMEKREEAEKL